MSRGILPEWRYWPAIPLAIFVLIAVVGGSLPIPARQSAKPQQSIGIQCNDSKPNRPGGCTNPKPTFKATNYSDPNNCESENPNKQAYNECLLTRYTGQLSNWTLALFVATGVLGFFGLVQASITGYQVWRERIQFNYLHRPQIVIHAVEFFYIVNPRKAGSPFFGANIYYFNKGQAPAEIVEISGKISRLTYPLQPEIALPLQKITDKSVISGGRGLASVTTDMPLIEQASKARVLISIGEAGAKGAAVFCLGRIVYLDQAKKRRETGWCRVLDVGRPGWDKFEAPEYEYGY